LYTEASGKELKLGRKDYKLSDFNITVLRKALHRLPFFHFSSLKKYFPHLKSQTEFITSTDYFASISVEVSGPGERISNLAPTDQLDITVQVLEQMSTKMKREFVEYKGTRKFNPYPLRDKIGDKQINVANDPGSDREYGVWQSQTNNANLKIPLGQKDWYAFNDNFGTSEEKKFVSYIDKVYDKLKDQYKNIYLLRNERHFKVYSFDNGQALEPDFVLFLEKEKPDMNLHYQIFIEPKGEHLIEHDQWKEDFLKQLKDEYDLDQVWKGKEYIIWGMPFYNEQVKRRDFEDEFGNIIRG
jgi:type III restriction enzyme